MSEGEFLITQKEAADFLQVSTKSISRYRKRGLPHQLILNPMTGKQEVRFRRADLERWHEGRQLLATYGRDGEEAAAPGPQAGGRPSPVPRADDRGFSMNCSPSTGKRSRSCATRWRTCASSWRGATGRSTT